QARKRLPLDKLQRLRVALAAAAEKTAQLWHGLRVILIDGTTTSLPDTPKNQRAYPQPGGQKPGCGFPLLKLVGLFSLGTGVLLDTPKATSTTTSCACCTDCSINSNPATWPSPTAVSAPTSCWGCFSCAGSPACFACIRPDQPICAEANAWAKTTGWSSGTNHSKSPAGCRSPGGRRFRGNSRYGCYASNCADEAIGPNRSRWSPRCWM